MQYQNESAVRAVAFEHEAMSRLGALGLVRLDQLATRPSAGAPEVEDTHGRATVIYSPKASSLLIAEGGVIPVLWEFRRCRDGPSERYKIKPTRFRLWGAVQPATGSSLYSKQRRTGDTGVAEKDPPRCPVSEQRISIKRRRSGWAS